MAQNNFTPIDNLMKKKNPIIGGGHLGTKEAAPQTVLSKEFSEIQEVVEHKPEKEIEEFVKPRAETIEIPPDVKKLGAQPTSTPQFSTLSNIKLPISDDKIMAGIHAPITSSLRWLATFALYVLACGHVALKKVHGKIVRVIKT